MTGNGAQATGKGPAAAGSGQSLDSAQTTIASWLIGPARRECPPAAIVGGLAERLVAAGVPLWRVRIGQRVANPMISAWGVIWNQSDGAELYTVPRSMLDTGSYRGSPFETVINSRKSVRRSLERLEPNAHTVFFELAAAGGTDYLALPIEYGDGSVQGAAFTANRPAALPTRRQR